MILKKSKIYIHHLFANIYEKKKMNVKFRGILFNIDIGSISFRFLILYSS